jgi:carbon storage regulator
VPIKYLPPHQNHPKGKDAVKASRLTTRLEESETGVRCMLVLSRPRDESIIIGDHIVVTIVDIRGDKVRLGIKAPPEISVHREEIYNLIQQEAQQKEATNPDLKND